MSNNHGFPDEVLARYAKGTLDPETSSSLERAAAIDEGLAAEMALVRGLIAMEGSEPSHSKLDDHGWVRLARAIEEGAKTLPSQPRFAIWQMASAAALAVTVWQLGAVPFLDRPSSPEATYELAGADSVKEFSAQVTFVPDIVESDLRAALLSVDAQIAAGPTTLGVYHLAFRSQIARDKGIARLLTQTHVVDTIEAD